MCLDFVGDSLIIYFIFDDVVDNFWLDIRGLEFMMYCFDFVVMIGDFLFNCIVLLLFLRLIFFFDGCEEVFVELD